MEPKDITALAIKFFGIYLLVNIVIYAPSMIAMMTSLESYSGEEFNSDIYFTVVGSFMLVGVLVSLLLFRISNSIVSSMEGNEAGRININQELLLQVLGVYFVISAVSGIGSIKHPISRSQLS